MTKTQTLEYNKDKGTISLCTYSDDGQLYIKVPNATCDLKVA